MNIKNKAYNFLNKVYFLSPLPSFNNYYLSLINQIRLIEKVQFFSRKELNKYQDYHFRRLIIHTYNNVPYYKRWFREKKICLNDVKKVNDIKKLPLITKEIITKNYSDFLSLNSRIFKPSLCMTSGSSGIPFKFLIDKFTLLRYLASGWRIERNHKVTFHDKRVKLRGTLVHEHGKKIQDVWKYGFFNKTLEFNTFHMNEKICRIIITKILKFQPKMLHVYPMALYQLSLYLNKLGIEISKLKVIISSSESFSKDHRNLIKQVFNCPFIDVYGQSEKVLHAYECKPENGYHIVEENNILELLDKNSEQVQEGEFGRIIGTNLYNYSMPLIRYSTEDLAVMGGNDCTCGRHTKKLKSIQGRVLDQIITEDKSLISGISFYHYWKHRISEKIPNISYVQIIQPEINKITIKILPNKKYSDNDEKVIINEMYKLVGNMKISFEYINKRPIDKKWRFTISKIPEYEINKYI